MGASSAYLDAVDTPSASSDTRRSPRLAANPTPQGKSTTSKDVHGASTASTDAEGASAASKDTEGTSTASTDAEGASSSSENAVDLLSASVDVVDAVDTPSISSGIRRSTRLAAKPISAASTDAEGASSSSENAVDLLSASVDVVDAPSTSLAAADAAAPANIPARGRATKYIIKHMFTPAKLHKVSQLYRKAVYSHTDIPSKKKAVMAVLYHGLDHPGSSLDDKIRYHQHCGDWCDFVKWLDTDQPLEDFRKSTTKDPKGNIIPWTGGVYANLDHDFPDAFKQLEAIFMTLGNDVLMARTSTIATQNINESAHQKLWNICNKFKKHTFARYLFACRHVLMEHNFGKERASLLHKLGGMTYDTKNNLKNADKESIRVAKRKHEMLETGARQNRKKSSYTPREGDAYVPGGEDLQGEVYIPGGLDLHHDEPQNDH